MSLAQALARDYVGGQIEIQNPSLGYLYRGEIASIAVQGEGDAATLVVDLSWIAKSESDDRPPARWIADTNLIYRARLKIYAAFDIGAQRLALISSLLGETAVLFPPNGSKLDPSRVEGLDLTLLSRPSAVR